MRHVRSVSDSNGHYCATAQSAADGFCTYDNLERMNITPYHTAHSALAAARSSPSSTPVWIACHTAILPSSAQ